MRDVTASQRPNQSTALALILGAVLGSGIVLRAQDRPGTRVDFAREILPLLSNKCFVCHGPGSKKKDLVRLDSYAGATRDLGGYRAIDPNALERSRIPVRIHDTEDPMPPEKSGKTLTRKERELISRWILEGGEYAKHWAFVAPRKQPPTKLGSPTDNLIDGYVLARLEEKGIDFAREADRATLARRAALVLTGLPPEPAQLAAFLADKRADAYPRLIDELLASPRFGEHQARYWLDAVRYGDTHGLHLDNRRGIYPYRDWVVHAFNANLPLDDFITWQVAGDLLPDPTLAQRVATGYVRMNPSTSEGGAIPAEFQAKNNFDRSETLGTVMLGMTMTCTRCHTHKFDPITQKDYYRLFAFFNSTAESPLDGNRYAYAPVVEAPGDQAAWQNWSAIESEMVELLAEARDEITARMSAVTTYAVASAGWKTGDWRMSKRMARDAVAPKVTDLPKAKRLPGVLPRFGLKSDKAVFVAFDVKVPVDQVLWLKISGGAGSEVRIDDRAIASQQILPDQRGARIPLAFSRGSHRVLIRLVGPKVTTPVEVRLANPWQVLAKAKGFHACGREDRLFMVADPKGPFADLAVQKRALALATRMIAAKRGFTTTLVARDLDTPRKTRVLRRGEYNLPTGETLAPGVPEVMSAFPEGAPRNRLGLARWLTSRKHPLVARVLINRIWQRTFGAGLVRTPEDFGRQGEQPTHPRLLDWLAVELQDSGWNLKHMLRRMVTSQTFRQRSAWRRGVDDPENRLLARGPSHRLDAEVIRDIALWASGLLDPTMGGEGVRPHQPLGLWAALAHPASNTKRYVPDKGRKLYRRSLYVYWKRTSPHPVMTLFDAPSREASCVKRSRTSTPLQSLGLFNETQRLEMGRMLAQRLLREADDDALRLDLLFRKLACRVPTDRERAACIELLHAMRARYARAEKDALALLDRPGHTRRDRSLDPAEHAAWSQLAITVLASDVAILLY